MGASVEIQKALIAQLRAASALTAQLAAHPYVSGQKAVLDYVPQAADGAGTAAFPYVVVGETTEAEWDTDSTIGRESTVTIHAWSRYRGFSQVKAIMDAVKAALHDASFAVSGETMVLCFFEFADVVRDPTDPEGLVQHGVQRFRLITQGS